MLSKDEQHSGGNIRIQLNTLIKDQMEKINQLKAEEEKKKKEAKEEKKALEVR